MHRPHGYSLRHWTACMWTSWSLASLPHQILWGFNFCIFPPPFSASLSLQQMPCLLLPFTIFTVFGQLDESTLVSMLVSLCASVQSRTLAKQVLWCVPMRLKGVNTFRSAYVGLPVVRRAGGVCQSITYLFSPPHFRVSSPQPSLTEVLPAQATPFWG